MAYLGEQGPLFFNFLHTVSHQPLHCFGAVLVQLAKIWGRIPSAHHEDDLSKEQRSHLNLLPAGLKAQDSPLQTGCLT